MLILKGFAVDEQTAVVVEVDRLGLPGRVGLGVGEAVPGGLLGWAAAGALDRANGVAGMG